MKNRMEEAPIRSLVCSAEWAAVHRTESEEWGFIEVKIIQRIESRKNKTCYFRDYITLHS